MSRTGVQVYTDGGKGASEACVAITIRELKRALSWLTTRRESAAEEKETFTVDRTDATAIKRGALQHCRLLVMPGGRDLPYCSALNGAGNEEIRDFVKKGGSYLGLCAGGYYGASHVQFSVGDPVMEVVGPRELNFYPGVARGPVFQGFQYNSNAGAKVCEITLQKSSKLLQKNMELIEEKFPNLSVYYNGGCYFTRSTDSNHGNNCSDLQISDIEILATYHTTNPGHQPTIPFNDTKPIIQTDVPLLTNDPPAIVSMQYGTGQVILSGVHFESSADNLMLTYSDDKYIEKLASKLLGTERAREQFFNTILSHLVN